MRRALLTLVVVLAGATFVAPAGAATLHATSSNFASTYASAAGGDTILLASGSYGSWNGGAKSSMVTIAPETGASVSFSGGTFGSSVRNLTIKGVTYTGPIGVYPGTTPLNLVFDGITMGAVGPEGHEGRMSIIGGGTSAIGGNGVQVKNSTFGPGGCSDGIQDSSKGTEIGPGNEFKGIVQGSCSEHVDAIQPYDSNYVWIHDNYLHDNEQGIMAPDGPSTGWLIENNVIHTTNAYPTITLGHAVNGTVRHNVSRNGNIRVYGGNEGVNSSGMVIKDNVGGVNNGGCTNCTITNNPSTSQITYTGGTGRCAYATASPKGTASDGTDVGLNDCSGTSPPPPTDHTPAAAFVYTPASPTTGSNVTFDASSSTCDDTPCTYHWHDVGSDGSGDWPLGPDGKTMSFAFQGAGTKYVELVVTDTDGDTDTVQHNVTVSDGPPPPPSDRDGDGVPDASDACPDVAGTQPDGCPPPDPNPVCDQACVDQYDAQIASLTQQLADMTTSRDNVQALADAYKARAETAEAKVAELQARIDAAITDLTP